MLTTTMVWYTYYFTKHIKNMKFKLPSNTLKYVVNFFL